MFQWIFHKKELLTTFDRGQYDRVCDKLSGMGIPYKTKWHSDASSGRARGTVGRLGQKEIIQYYIYVKKENLEQAKMALG